MNRLKNRLKNKEVTLGTWLQIPHPSIVEIISYVDYKNHSKMDWICVDLEHGIIDIESMTNVFRVIEKEGYVPVARIPKNDYIWIHRVLDAGAKGLIVPMVKNREDINYICNEALYPPIGKRSFGYSRSNIYGAEFERCIQCPDDIISIIPQIEHIDAIDNLKEILSHPNIDSSFIGPLDLMGSMGLIDKEDKTTLDEAISTYKNVSKALNVPLGMHVVEPDADSINSAIDEGFTMIAVSLDTAFLRCGVEKVLRDIRR